MTFGRHYLVIHDWNEEEDQPDWWEIEHESCQLQTNVYEESIYEPPTEEELDPNYGPLRICRPTGKVRLIFESYYDNCPVENEIDNVGIEAFGDTSRTSSWVDFDGTRQWTTTRNLWPDGLPRVPGRYEIAFWVTYYPGEYGGAGDCDSGLRLVDAWYNLDGTRHDRNDMDDYHNQLRCYSFPWGSCLTGWKSRRARKLSQ